MEKRIEGKCKNIGSGILAFLEPCNPKSISRRAFRLALVLVIAIISTGVQAIAQFSGSVQGYVHDPSGASIGHVAVTLVNVDTNVTQQKVAETDGAFNFVSVAPGSYQILASAQGFATAKVAFVLHTDEVRDVPIELEVGTAEATVTVTTQAALLDTADSRNQLTINSEALQRLPVPALNPLDLVSLAPGVTGVGLLAEGNSPTTPPTNFGPGFTNIGANGRGVNGDIFIIDGLDITGSVNPAILTSVPQADALSEITVQANTYAVDYGKVSALQTVMTTKAGDGTFHGWGSEYYEYEGLNARGEFASSNVPQAPYHVNNMSFGLGGPLLPKQKLYFFFAIEPYLAEVATGNQVQIVEDPAFVSFAQNATSNSPELTLLTKYSPSAASLTGIAATAQSLFGPTNVATNSGCGTPSTDNIPCATPIFDTAVFNAVNPTRARQIDARIDKNFSKDRIYGVFIGNANNTNHVNLRPAFATLSFGTGYVLQGNETHTFSPRTLNEAAFGWVYYQSSSHADAPMYTIPTIKVNGLGASWGTGGYGGPNGQTNIHWRDVLTQIAHSHALKFGYEGWWGSHFTNSPAAYAIPTFYFNSMIDLINNNPLYETGLSYNPLTGKSKAYQNEYAMRTFGFFAEDSWRVTHRITLNYGVRYDNYGNAYATNGTTLANFIPGTGSTFADQIANGVMKVRSNVFNHDQNWIFSPRVGIAFDPTGKGVWAVHGGLGVYRDWINLGNQQSALANNPPFVSIPTFYNNGSTSAPIFAYGTSNSYPFGYPYPQFGGQPLNSAGGYAGGQFAVGGMDPNASTPLSLVWSGTVERQLSDSLVASAGYIGQHSSNLFPGSSYPGTNTFGTDVNVFVGDLLQHPGCTPAAGQTVTCNGIQTRLNPNFGSILFAYNGARANYEAFFFSLNGRFARRGFLTASYTHSSAKDNTDTTEPAEYSLERWYGPSLVDIPDRFSLGANYNLPGIHDVGDVLGRIISGWKLSGTLILESGNPYSVYTTARFDAQSVNGGPLQFLPDSGNFRADGDYGINNGFYGLSLPNISNYGVAHTRSAYRQGLFPTCAGTRLYNCGPFSFPAMGQEGNEAINQFRNPGLAQTNLSINKETKLSERLNLELRIDSFNAFNRVNLQAVDWNAADFTTFGKSTSSYLPRTVQLSAKITF